ncbi:MAG: ABC transporter ATP-binding protein [Epsilonproteobacteria bacterium]|nr:MAG: ABC transporter ATP-binding protein [Campylobacterota bacterium]RLA68057.1 MAG: ABC transporter ATP-binding protein [Campylobacterota bacterium]
MIKVSGLTKFFSQNKVVDNISFEVNKGEVLGFLGPNGAGKSTTMKMLSCFIDPSSGDASICGYSILKNPNEIRKIIGYVPENAPLYDDMYVWEFLEFIAELRIIPVLERDSAILNVVKMCALEKVKNQKIETLSKGYKRRVSLAQALIHDPEVLFLDEPTDGLDPNQKYEVRKLIKELAVDKQIILSTHILEEVEAVCSRAVIISHGKILFDGTPDDLKKKSQTGKVDDVFRAYTTGELVQGVSL